jgi:hypothetical protein
MAMDRDWLAAERKKQQIVDRIRYLDAALQILSIGHLLSAGRRRQAPPRLDRANSLIPRKCQNRFLQT